MKDATRILTRHPSNPIIKVGDYPGFMTVFNPAPAMMYKGQTILLISMVRFQSRRGGETYVATSDDGVHFQVEEEPFIRLHEHPYPFSDFCHHVIDNRVTQIDDTYYILTPAKCNYAQSPVTVLGKTKDFKHYEPIEIIDYPKVRGTSLFPGKIDGKYYKLIRPGAGTGSHGEIWIASSPDLVNWGSYRPFLTPGYCPFWNSQKIGPTPPIKTSRGWLEIVHGVSTPCDGAHYYIGAVLMDLDQPWKIIGKTYSYLLAPETPYERNGQVGNVVFPCGALADESKDELRLYYGAADTCIGLATGKLSEVIQACIDEI